MIVCVHIIFAGVLVTVAAPNFLCFRGCNLYVTGRGCNLYVASQGVQLICSWSGGATYT